MAKKKNSRSNRENSSKSSENRSNSNSKSKSKGRGSESVDLLELGPEDGQEVLEFEGSYLGEPVARIGDSIHVYRVPAR